MAHRILVVDDVKDTAESLAALVKAMGYEAKSVTDPRDAVGVARSFQPVMVLLDIGMPYINGYDLAPMLRAALEPLPVRIVAVTAWGSAQDREHSRALGFDAHLVKPADLAVIQATIEKLLREPS